MKTLWKLIMTRYWHSSSLATKVWLTSYKPTPVLNSLGKLEAIVGNIHDMKSTQSIFKIEGDEVGSCFTIERHETIPMNHCPEMPLGADAVKGTCYEDVDDEVALIALPIVAPLPFGFDLKSLRFGRRLCWRNEEGFWRLASGPSKCITHLTSMTRTLERCKSSRI